MKAFFQTYCLEEIHYCGNNQNRIAEDASFGRKCTPTAIRRSNTISISLEDNVAISLDNRLDVNRKISVEY